jgi:WD40 repeat protein
MKVMRSRCGVAAAVLCTTLAACSAQPAWQVTRTLVLPHGIQALDWHPDGKHIAVTYSDPARLAQVWDVEHGTGLKTFPSLRWGTTQSGKEIGFSPDGKYLVVQDVLSNRPENHPFPSRVNP